ncbi:hypothetical protein PR202_gb06983 [Eleusine coracana subsp. coracana]|uniref:Uncharacterized protein n=1 Tax=Eleusine coracana subsp. coracana TaxID=191504 RepID=A0AAV5EA80_ELECO|nr:hypothetical protein PR202_gb06983 [Eleusine coracana subsp. coracana]
MLGFAGGGHGCVEIILVSRAAAASADSCWRGAGAGAGERGRRWGGHMGPRGTARRGRAREPMPCGLDLICSGEGRR